MVFVDVFRIPKSICNHMGAIQRQGRKGQCLMLRTLGSKHKTECNPISSSDVHRFHMHPHGRTQLWEK